MKLLKIILTIGKISGIIALLLTILFCFCLYTHPVMVENSIADIWPAYRNTNFSFKGGFEKCEDYEFYPSKLNDKYYDYIFNSEKQKFGDPLQKKEEIRELYLAKKLEYVDSSDFYVVDTLYHSFSFLTHESKKLLDEIGEKFKFKLKNTSFKNARIRVTSLLRTEKSVKKLRRSNRNSVKTSSHLHGTTFDLAHHEFATEQPISLGENLFLRLTLAETLKEFRENDRCFVTYESRQACFHVVNKAKN